MSDSTFYSDRVGHAKPRVNEEVTANAWPGLVALIEARIRDGSLACAFPRRDCTDRHDAITGTDEDMFLDSLLAHIPELDGRVLEADFPVSTNAALDIVDFVAAHINQPARRQTHVYFEHEHLSFRAHHANPFHDELSPGQAKFRDDIDLLFGRNGIAFTLGDDMRVRRLGPPRLAPCFPTSRRIAVIGISTPSSTTRSRDSSHVLPVTGGTPWKSCGMPSRYSRT